MTKSGYSLWSRFLTKFGYIKVFKYPFWLVYDPDDFEVTGEKVLEVMNILKPGDVVLRGYNHYLDGKFVPDELKFSHGAMYVGDGKLIHAVAEGVSEIDVIEFTRCDRVAVLRPKRGQKAAIAKAKELLKKNTPYDFGFNRGVSSVYCFELCGEAYSMLDIPRKTVKMLFGLIRRKDVFLAKSFFDSPDFDCIFHFNPRFQIDFSLKKRP